MRNQDYDLRLSIRAAYDLFLSSDFGDSWKRHKTYLHSVSVHEK